MVPIVTLTLRALGRGRRLVVVALLLAVPALLALAYRISAPYARQSPPVTDSAAVAHSILPFLIGLVEQLVVPILLPFTALIFATSALGSEVEDHTLVYVSLRPVPRLVIAVAKGLAAALLTVVLVEVALAVMYVVGVAGLPGAGRGLGAIALAGLAGGLAYSSLFLLVGLVAPRRALIVGFLYVLLWEGTAAGLSTAAATLSVRRYVQGVLDAALSGVTVAGLTAVDVDGAASTLVLAGIVVGGIALTTWRLRRMELP